MKRLVARNNGHSKTIYFGYLGTSFYPMDTTECSRSWKLHAPDTHGMRLTAMNSASDKRATEWEKEQPQKSVTMAPSSWSLTDRQYVMRKPQFSIERSSILKKTQRQQQQQQQQHQHGELHVGSRANKGQHSARTNGLTRLGENLNSASSSFSPTDDVASHSASKDVCSSLWGIPDVSSRLHEEEEETLVGSTLTRSERLRCGLSSNIAEFQQKSPPQLTSTALYPTSSPSPPFSLAKTEPKEQKTCSLAEEPRRRSVTYHQANYWDCAIPKSLPKFTNRHSASWDPNKEYQALLDYTYPLKPEQTDATWDSSAGFQGDSQDLNLQDSGIQLNSPGSTVLSVSDLNLSNSVGPNIAWDTLDGEIDSSAELFLDRFDFVTDRDLVNCHLGRSQRHPPPYAQSSSVVPRVFPQSQSVVGDLDKEFWSLPDNLEEVQLLARQVKEVTARLKRMGPASNLLTRSPPEKQVSKEAGQQQGLTQDSLEEVGTLVERLCGVHLRDAHKEERDQSCSLMQHIRMFCSLLERYIHWLYEVSEKTDAWARPVDNMKRSLAEYQQELSCHQHLTSHVLQTGELLLGLMDNTSPLLRNTLLLVERQSRVMEDRTQRLMSFAER
ncbi:centrosomal protein of 68 kDa isoform X2 [Syngnathus scovelli]|uniref:centrosomal protein of 68 kDa isoform X2 n=1 Tax=Syngnathus scovelli TaxID=161590 RepID=UPI00210FB7DD|nr:centrosomal protein of 68 kDa isoform X2 [Syngnathus scovelli]